MTGPALLIRADADARIGTGHLMRCIALAEAWREAGGRATFACAALGDALAARLADEGFERLAVAAATGGEEDAAATLAHARSLGAGWIAVDGYRFGADYLRALVDGGWRLLVVDDCGRADDCPADVLLNQNIGAAESLYPGRRPSTRLLLGTSYALLRREFRAAAAWRREVPAVAQRLLITLGGADPDNLTLLAARAGARPSLETLVVVGASFAHLPSLERLAAEHPSLRVERNVRDMPSRMRWADVAVAGGGSTCWELALLGLPSLLIVLADNQREIAAGLDAAGAAIDLGWHAALTVERVASALDRLAGDAAARRAMSDRARALVDGEGAARVVAAMREDG